MTRTRSAAPATAPAATANGDPVAAPSLYRRVLGAGFERLPPSLRALHARAGVHRYAGQGEAVRGSGLLSRLCGWIAGLPPAHTGPIEVEIEADADGETWTRRFGAAAMRSRLRERAGLIHERLGPMAFAFALEIDRGGDGNGMGEGNGHGDGVIWRLRSVRALGLGLPLAWFDGMRAREFERDGRYRFEVRAALPGVGLLVDYRGWLAVDG